MDFTSWDAGLHTEDNDYLEHYGVLGMKWGQRRFQYADGSLTPRGEKHYAKTGEYGYHYKSHATKKYTKKAAKAEAKGKTQKAAIYKNRAKRSAELDKREQEASKHVSVGKALATRLLFGGATSKGYQQYRAMAGGGHAGAATKGVSRVLSYYGGSMGSRLAKAAYIRKGEKNHGLANAVNTIGSKTVKATKFADNQARKVRRKVGI